MKSIHLLLLLCMATVFRSYAFVPLTMPPVANLRSESAPTTPACNAMGRLQMSAVDCSEDESTVVSLTSPSGQSITLIGTAHLSDKSNDQVQRLIESLQPNVVMVELDPTRLHRIGINSIDDIQVPKVTTTEGIELPLPPKSNQTPWFLQPFVVVQQLLVEAFTRITRRLMTGMYNDMGDKMKTKDGGGGEFLRAIRAAENCTACDTLVLGDRSSLTTIQRAAELALESGDPLGVLNRLQEANGEEIQQLEDKVRQELQLQQGPGVELEDSTVSVTMMERLKEDTEFRNRLFGKLEKEVPEFTQAFLKERDYLMSESIRRELDRPEVKTVVGVVGLGHVPGMETHLKAVFSKDPVPLVTDIAATP